MHRTLSLAALMLLVLGSAASQVASHASTIAKPALGPADSMVPLTVAGKPVALVNGAVLTDVDLVREEYTIFPYAKQHNGLPKELASQIRDGALKMIVFEELVYQEALRRNMTVTPARMQRAEADFRKQFSTPAEFNALLQSEFKGSQKLLDEKVRRSLLIEAFLKTEVENKSVVTPADIKAYYDKSNAQFTHPETYTFQTISVLPPPKATAAQLKEGRTRIESAYTKAKAAKSAEEFGMLAEKLSDDDYRVVLGQHKPVPVDQLAPPVLKALRTMKPGGVTDIIQLDQAYTVVRLNAHSPAGKTPLAEVRAKLAKDLHESRRNQLRKDLDKKLRQNAKIEEM